MEKLLKYLGYFDYVGAIASLGWGIWNRNAIWIGFGAVGLLFAWWSPATRVSAYAQKKLLGRRKTEASLDFPEPEEIAVETSAPFSPDYGYRTNLPYPRGVRVFRFKGADSYQTYALFIGERFGKKR